MGAYEYPDCPEATIASADPPDCTYDARRPHDQNDASLENREGIGSPNDGLEEPITITLSPAESGATNPACWSLCETGIEETAAPALLENRIHSITEVSTGVYEILLERPISAGNWTTIGYAGDSDTISYASLPADSGADGVTTAGDILDLIDCCLNETCTPPFGIYSCDIDHSGAANSTDTLELIDLLNGAGLHLEWNGVEVADNTCGDGDCDGESAAMAGPGESFDAVSFSARYVDFIQSFVPGETFAAADFSAVATALLEMNVARMTWTERSDLAEMLKDAEPEVRSQVAADLIPNLIEILAR